MAGLNSLSTAVLSIGVWLDGTFFRGGAGYPAGSAFSHPGGSNLLRTLAGSTISQDIWAGGDAPVNLHPMKTTMSFSLTKESDLWLFQEAVGYGRPIQTWFDWPVSDQWYLPAASAQTFKTSRMLPWGSTIPGVTQVTRPPVALIDGVSQTVVTGTPTTGQVKVPDSGGVFGLIEKNSADNGTRLILRYNPIFLMSFGSFGAIYVDSNHVRFTITAEEHLGNVYTLGV